MREIPYNRSAALAYARRWALGRNTEFFNFDDIGGDCTNFISQCVYAGTGVMNYAPVTGWYYISVSDRSASWTGVEFFYNFMVNNRSVGPYGRIVTQEETLPGDIIQLGRENGSFYHSLIILSKSPEILVAAHSNDALNRPLSSYDYYTARYIRIDGARSWQ